MRSKAVIGRQQRVLRILERLRAGDTVRPGDLAQQWQVSRRTVFRDLDLLRDAGIPVQFDQKKSSYCVASDVADTPPLGLDELTVLVAAVHFSILQHLPTFHERLDRTLAKLLSRSPYQVRQSVSRLTRACVVGTFEDGGRVNVGHMVTRILEAIGQRRELQVAIVSRRDEVVHTRFSPYQMIAAPDAWHVVGRSTFHHAIRIFDPRQFIRAEMTDHTFAIPREYDLST